MTIIENFKKIIKDLYADNLYKNSFYLMLYNIVNGFLGFIFLITVTHIYSSHDIGIYFTMFSAMNVIILISMSSGIYNTLIRFIPQASQSDKNKLVVSFFILHCLIVTIVSLIFVSFIEIFSPKLIFLRDFFYGFIFILFTIFFAVLALFNNGIFMAFRKIKYIIICATTTNIGKIILLPLFTAFLYMGIFYSTGIGMLLGVIISLFLLYKTKLINEFKLSVDFGVVKKNFKYLLTNHISSNASELPPFLFPILIFNLLSAEMTAYFFVAWTIFWLMVSIIVPPILSFFIEGAYNENENKKNIKKALKISFIIATICIIGIFLFGKFVLSFFGNEYLNSLNLLYIFAISAYLFLVNKIYLYELFIKKKLKESIIFNYLISIITLIFGTLLMFYFGLIGVGYGWLIGQLAGIIWILARLKLS